MRDLLEKIGCYCQKGHRISMLQSSAGYYIGTLEDDEPYCRLSGYGHSPDDPVLNEERECIENQWCNGNSLSGCRINVTESRKHGYLMHTGK